MRRNDGPSRAVGVVACQAPRSASQVAQWARTRFEAECAPQRADASLNLPLACLLVALEEEAAAALQHESSAALRRVGSDSAESSGRAMDGVDLVARRPRDHTRRVVGSASTWSLERLDALSAEAAAQLHARTPPESPAQRRDDAAGAAHSAGTTPGNGGDAHGGDGGAPAAAQVVGAINAVLYERHGYRRRERHGDVRSARWSDVLDNGLGSPAALTIIYCEVAARLGLPLAAAALDGGAYWVAWPALPAQPLRLGGEEFVIDPYSGGDLLHSAEVAELFGMDARGGQCAPLRAARKRELLDSLLADLQHAHWCAALGCPAEPALAVPLDVHTALAGDVGRVAGHDMDRALAAAERRLYLQPSALSLQLEYGLLLCFAGRHEDGWQELALFLEQVAATDGGTEAARVEGGAHAAADLQLAWQGGGGRSAAAGVDLAAVRLLLERSRIAVELA